MKASERHKRALAAREQVDALRALAARRGVHLDVAVERLLGVLQAQVALAAAEQRHEDLAEVLAHLRERREEQLARGHVDLPDGLLQRVAGVGEIGALRAEKLESPRFFLVLLDGERVHRTECIELGAQFIAFRAQLIVVELHRGE